MGATVELVRIAKESGHHTVWELGPMDQASTGEHDIFFAGSGHMGNGYYLEASETNATWYPVRAGSASWEAWIVAKFGGVGFSMITGVTMYMESFDDTDMGTIPSTTYLIEPDVVLIPYSGLFMRSAPGPIELGADALPLSNWVPAASPSFGLPLSAEGWVLFAPYHGGDFVFEGSGTEPPTAVDLTPLDGITVASAEPRYSNVAILNLCVAPDAVEGIKHPIVMGVTWTES